MSSRPWTVISKSRRNHAHSTRPPPCHPDASLNSLAYARGSRLAFLFSPRLDVLPRLVCLGRGPWRRGVDKDKEKTDRGVDVTKLTLAWSGWIRCIDGSHLGVA